MTESKQSKLQIYLLLGAFALALAFRLVQLGKAPLDDREAALALQALGAARKTNPTFGGHAAYVGLTSVTFFIFSASEFLARFWPALIGALAVFVPQVFKKWIGEWPAVVLSLVLAISPEMVGLSRLVGTPIMAVVLLLLGLGLFFQRKPVASGICLALALMRM